MRAAAIYTLIFAAILAGWLLFDWLQRRIQPKKSARRSLLLLLVFMLFMVLYTGGIVLLVRLIFGKPS
jgi:predicted PurR-regulated permease PerM